MPAVPPRSSRGLLVRAIGSDRFGAARSLRRMATRDELRMPFPLAFKLRAWSLGFTVEQAVIYDIDRVDVSEYVTDYQRRYRCSRINPLPEIFAQKLILKRLLHDRGFVQPHAVALVTRHGVIEDPVGDEARHVTRAELERRLIAAGGRYIVKPQDGMYGRGIALLEVRDGRLIARRGHKEWSYNVERETPRNSLIERAVSQHPFWSALCPTSVNTLRVLTLWTPGDAEPFVAKVIQRIGSADTIPTDNWDTGGVASVVDIETGRLGPARAHPFRSRLAPGPHSQHPDTGTPIEGTMLPSWEHIRETVLAAARSLPMAHYVGWDIAVDDTGAPVFIEGNHNTGVRLLQFQGGLLTDPRVRRFYEVCGVV